MSESYVYKKSLVASLDILGVKEIIRGSQSLNIISVLHNEFSESINYVKQLDTEYHVANPYRFKVFSDNLAIVKELTYTSDVELELHNLSVIIMYFQMQLWCKHNLVVRGGISLGDCFIDDLMVLGPALLEAYSLESKVAIYPRVIISSQLVDYSNTLSFGKNDFSLDGDGYMYVDYISFWNSRDFSKVQKEKHIGFVKNNIKDCSSEHVKQKYLWLIEKIKVVDNGNTTKL